MIKTRLALPALVLAFLALAVAGCGGGGGGGGSSDLASIAPPGSPLFVEGFLRPEGELKSDVEAIAAAFGVEDLGGTIVSELESSAREDGEPFDYETEVEPWLGERAGVFADRFDGEEFTRVGVAVQTTDPEATQAFIDKQAQQSEDPIDDASYEGVDYKVDTADESVYGLVGDELLLVTEDEPSFKAAVDASNGDSLAGEEAFESAMSAASEGSLADVYADVGTLIEQAGDEIDDEALQAFEKAGIEPREATAIASVVPGADRVEIEISSDLGDQEAPSGDASGLLGSLPGDAFAAFAVSGFGEQLQAALDQLDKEGIPGQVPPGELKKGVSELGFDLDRIAASLEDAGLFASGTGEGNVGGALVLTTDGSSEVATAVKTIGALVRQSGTPGVSAVTGKASGFSVRDPEELGPQPLVVATREDRIAIGYGLRQTMQALEAGGGSTLAGTADYEAAVAALGDTPISGFVDGQGALQLAESFVPPSETEFREARKYLRSVRFVAIGSGTEGDRATAKLIVGLEG